MKDYIFPDPANRITLIRATGTQGNLLCGERLENDSPLARMIADELNHPFHQSMIRLNQCSRNFAGNTEGPNVLYLSAQEGGFPRQGLAIEGVGKFPRLNYVDLVLDEERVREGAMSIFTHELGHVMMANVWENFPQSRSPKQHVSMGVTDYPTAFFEGWGEHFQYLANLAIPAYQSSYRSRYDYNKIPLSLWHSTIDRDLRLNAVFKNSYIHRKPLPGIDLGKLDAEELILLEHTSPVFDPTRLKNAQEMLSCEGVAATLFYRINTNPVIQNNFQNRKFYERFTLTPLPQKTTPEEIFAPRENVFLKNFHVWSKLASEVSQESVLFTDYINTWCRYFGEDREEILKLFLATTVCKTVCNELAETYEKMAYYGMTGDMIGFQKSIKQFKQSLAEITERVIAGKLELDANIGPQLWVDNPDFLVRTCLWEPDVKVPLSVNLNTASEFDFASFPGVTPGKAREIVIERDKRDYFKSVGEVEELGFKVPPA